MTLQIIETKKEGATMNHSTGALRYFGRIKNGSTPASGQAEYWDGEVSWATPEDLGKLTGDRIATTKRQITDKAVEENNLSLLPVGSVLISTRAPIGHMAITAKSMAFNQGCRGIIPGDRVHGSFLYYLLKSYIPKLNAVANGTTFVELSRDELAAVQVSFPPLETQRRIARFLDDKTARIDGLIEKKRALLERLAEKRQALITCAVTKGLDSDAPMKPSGIDWLGDIPAHWEVQRLRFSVERIEQGWSPQCENRPAEPDEWGVLKVGCVNGESYDESDNKALPPELEPMGRYQVCEGDILISRANTKELLGSAALVTRTKGKIIFSDKLYRVHLVGGIDPKFLIGVLRSPVSRFQYEQEATGTSGSMQNIGQDTIKNVLHPLPPLAEQKQIGSWIEKTLKDDAALEGAIRASIERLEEYRSALITAAVTGQLEVA